MTEAALLEENVRVPWLAVGVCGGNHYRFIDLIHLILSLKSFQPEPIKITSIIRRLKKWLSKKRS